tara:strand:+ start:144 stop:563 length:420 start_codon:yes stop_codon:yes gene_type:complete
MSNKNNKKKGFKGKKSKELNVVPFKIKSLKEQKVETETEIWNKVDSFSKELVNAFKEKATREALSSDDCWYIFYYRLMQTMMFEMSYPAFKYYTNWTSRQLLKHHKDFMNSLDEWTGDPDEETDLFGRSKKANKDKILH